MRNALIIGGSIIIGFILAAIIVSQRFPRYQYVEYATVEKHKEGLEKTTSETIFDMVTGIKYDACDILMQDESGHCVSRDFFRFAPTAKPLLDVWLKQHEVFGDNFFTVEQWREWKKTNAW